MNLYFSIGCFLSCTWGGARQGCLVVFWRVEAGMSRDKYHFCLVCMDAWKNSWEMVSWFCLSFTFPGSDLKILLNSYKVSCRILLISLHL